MTKIIIFFEAHWIYPSAMKHFNEVFVCKANFVWSLKEWRDEANKSNWISINLSNAYCLLCINDTSIIIFGYAWWWILFFLIFENFQFIGMCVEAFNMCPTQAWNSIYTTLTYFAFLSPLSHLFDAHISISVLQSISIIMSYH